MVGQLAATMAYNVACRMSDSFDYIACRSASLTAGKQEDQILANRIWTGSLPSLGTFSFYLASDRRGEGKAIYITPILVVSEHPRLILRQCTSTRSPSRMILDF